MAKKRGIYTAVQYFYHPVTGEVLFREEMLSVASNKKSIKKMAVIIHDNDTYHQSDIDKQKERLKKEYIERQNEFVNEYDGTVSISCNDYVEQEMETTYSYIKIGELKGKHVHIVIFTGNSAIDTAELALWLGIPEHLIDIIPKGRGNRAWYDCLRYLTHETPQAIKDGKYIYSHNEVFMFGAEALSFDEELAEYERLMSEYGQILSEEEAMCMDVLQKGKTPKQCKEENPVLYAKLRDKLIKLHGDYLESLPQPLFRLNFYIAGEGGEGKWQFMVALARSLFPEIVNDKDLYFKVGGENVTFEGYNGQPVVIWDDCRSGDLIRKFGSRGAVFAAFNTFPERDDRVTQHVKFSVTNLTNKVNIVNSVESWEDFLDGLAGEYTDKDGKLHKAEDKKQSYRRFPMIFCLHPEDYDVLINKGFLEDTKEFLQYIIYRRVRGSFYKIADACKQNADLRRELSAKLIKPVITDIRQIEDHIIQQKGTDDEIRQRFSDYGTSCNFIQADDNVIESWKNYVKAQKMEDKDLEKKEDVTRSREEAKKDFDTMIECSSAKEALRNAMWRWIHPHAVNEVPTTEEEIEEAIQIALDIHNFKNLGDVIAYLNERAEERSYHYGEETISQDEEPYCWGEDCEMTEEEMEALEEEFGAMIRE